LEPYVLKQDGALRFVVGDGEMGTAGLLGMQEYGIHIEKSL
jgi:hypothetical protein